MPLITAHIKVSQNMYSHVYYNIWWQWLAEQRYGYWYYQTKSSYMNGIISPICAYVIWSEKWHLFLSCDLDVNIWQYITEGLCSWSEITRVLALVLLPSSELVFKECFKQHSQATHKIIKSNRHFNFKRKDELRFKNWLIYYM
jgi:hypothetical protein